MADSVLCQLARTSIVEVLQTQNLLDKQAILEAYPLLHEQVPTAIELWLDDEMRGSFTTQTLPLYDAISIGAKKAAFEDKNTAPLTTREYLHIRVKITLNTPEGEMSHQDEPILKVVENVS